jgi:hypothetical protein
VSGTDMGQWIFIIAHSVLIMAYSFDIEDIRKKLKGEK